MAEADGFSSGRCNCLVALAPATSSGPAGSSGAAERSPFRPQIFRPTDSLFFIPVRFWPPILCVLGVLFALIPADAFA